MKSFEVYCREFSQVIQCESIVSAIIEFRKANPENEVIIIENIEARNELQSLSCSAITSLPEGVEGLLGEEIKPVETITTAGDLPEKVSAEGMIKDDNCNHSLVGYSQCCYCGEFDNAKKIITKQVQSNVEDLSQAFINWYNSTKKTNGGYAPLAMQIFYWFNKRLLLFDASSLLTQRDAEIRELKVWKQSAISVMPDMQAIGKLLGVGLGEYIHDKIIPGIIKLLDRAKSSEDWAGEIKMKHDNLESTIEEKDREIERLNGLIDNLMKCEEMKVIHTGTGTYQIIVKPGKS